MSALYDNYKLHMLGAAAAAHTFPDLDTDSIKVGIVSGSDYVENLATHQDWSDTTYALDTCYNSEPTQTLANVSIGATGVFDNTADITFTAVAIDVAKVVDAIVHYRSGGVVTTDTLICLHDGFTLVTPNGGDIVIQYNASGIFGV